MEEEIKVVYCDKCDKETEHYLVYGSWICFECLKRIKDQRK